MAVLLARGQITIAAIKDGADGAQGPQGKPGKDGVDGEAAVSILVEDAPLIFDTNDNGIVPVSIGKVAKVKVMKGNQNISNRCSNISSRDDLCVNCKCGATQKNGYIEVSVSGSNISKNDVVIDGVNQGKVSATSGYAVVQLTYNGVTYFAQVPFSANVAKFTGVVAFDNKSYKQQFDEVTKRLDKAATKDELTHAKSEFEQTAREISLSVSEKSIARRNLLVGSAFQRDDNNRVLSNGARIEMNSGYQGTNCIKVNDVTDGTPHYPGVFWEGSQNGRSIKIEKGKKYTMSCFYKTNDINAKFYLEAIYTNKQENANRLGQATYSSSNEFTVKKVNEWELFTVVVDTTNAKSDYIAFNFWEACNVNAGQIEAWICRPMVEEGDYNGWTLSTEDYDYVGGNMLDNTLSLDKSGTLYDVNGTLTPLGFGESTSIYKSFTYKLKGTVYSFSQLPSSGNTYGDTYYVSNTETCYRYNGSEFENVGNDYYYNILQWGKLESGGFVPFGLEANKDYVFSFMAKGTGKLSAYFYNPDTNVFVESSLGVAENNVNGQANFQLTSDWKKYWVHWRPSDSAHKYILLRLNRTIQSSAGDAPITDCYIAQPKLEAGAVVTEYTERKSDLVDKASLKAAGVLVDAESVTLYGNQVHIKKDKNSSQDTMLIDNETGKVSAALIDAKKIVAEGVETQDLIISGSSRSPFSQAEDGKDMPYSDNVFLQGKNEWINSYALKWDATQSGRLIRLANYNWNDNATSGYGRIKTPDASYFFFVNGEKWSQLYISENEMVELLGIGDKMNFIGWAVVNRIHLNNYLNGMNVPILMMGNVETLKKLSGNGYYVSSNVRTFRGFGDYNGNNPTEVIETSRVGTGIYRLLLQPEFAKYLYGTEVVVQATGIGMSLDGINPSMPIKATFNGIHFGSYPKYEGSYIEICTSDDSSKNEGSFFIEVKCMNFFGSNS